jgi:hypothetical protein
VLDRRERLDLARRELEKARSAEDIVGEVESYVDEVGRRLDG